MDTSNGGLIIARRLTAQVSRESQKPPPYLSRMAELDNLKFLLPLIATLYVVFFLSQG